VAWPGGHRFAFTIFDDTDGTTVASGRPVYDLLGGHGLRITKSVWPLGPERPPSVGGQSCDDPDYLAWVRDLEAAGHEIGYHHASDHSSDRARTRRALDRFRELFGADPRAGADHAGNVESLAGGSDRLTGVRRAAYRAAERWKAPDRPRFSGADPASPWFWGDLCRERITYWRSLTFAVTDLFDVCRHVPFHDPSRPFVDQWFLSADAPRADLLLARLRPAALDRLERQGGLCILYTHLGLDLVEDGRVRPELVAAVADLAGRDAWFAPVSEVLDHVRSVRGDHVLTGGERRRLEWRWLADRARAGERLGPRVATHGREAW
jgi:hypothetical protein